MNDGRPRLGGRWRIIAVALAPWALLAAAPVALLAALARRPRLAIAAGTAAVGGALVARDVAGRRDLVEAPVDLRIAHANLLMSNERLHDVAVGLAAIDADVIGLSEYTGDHARALLACPLAAAYPHRIDRPAPRASGAAMWSKRPIAEVAAPRTVHEACAADVALDGERLLRVLTVHTISPMHHTNEWARDLDVLAQATWRPDRPSVMVGDFNASWLHGELRDVLANGWRLAHRLAGRGMSCSWRTDPPFVPFVRIDHALVSDGVDVVDVRDFDVPGSDHRGFVVSVAVR